MNHRRVVLGSLGLLPLIAAGTFGPACGGSEGSGNVFAKDTSVSTGTTDGGNGPILIGGGRSDGTTPAKTDATGPAVCGDGLRQRTESCDDGNAVSGDGCSATCIVESGWVCAIEGASCAAAKCGDGLRIGDEECDDGNATAGDGCDASCKLQEGFQCVTQGAPCTPTICGNSVQEGSEQCDDGNLRPYDGCALDCHKEPTCMAGAGCAPVCGDGLKYPSEACDDGNTRSGDGCSTTCTEEAGFSCTVQTQALPAFVDLPIVYRDFKRGDDAASLAAGGHPDFETFGGEATGMVQQILDAAGKPQMQAPANKLTSSADFAEWYRDGSRAKIELGTLRLGKQSDGSYVFDSAISNPDGAPNPGEQFFPLTGKGWASASEPAATRETQILRGTTAQNFHFTSEVKFWFSYDAAATAPRLEFSGDDDVWVFINGKLALDIGGVHGVLRKSVTIHPTCVGVPNTSTDVCKIAGSELSLSDKNIYEIAVFQAERHITDSNYKLTLRGFERAKSVCAPRCGDGVKTRTEACDEGAGNDPSNTPAYGKCSADCRSRGGYCGDGTVQSSNEECDGNDGCNANCTLGGGPA